MTAHMLVGAIALLTAALALTVGIPLARIRYHIKRAADAIERLEDERE